MAARRRPPKLGRQAPQTPRDKMIAYLEREGRKQGAFAILYLNVTPATLNRWLSDAVPEPSQEARKAMAKATGGFVPAEGKWR